MSSTSNHTNTNARSTQEHVPDILGPSLVRKRGVEHIVVRQKRRFPEVDPRLVKNLIDTNDMRRRERSLPPPPKSPQPPQPQPQRPGTGLQGLRVRPPPPNRLREIPDEYDYPVTALLVDMEERFGRPLTIDIPDIPTPSSRRVVRDHDANKAANANVNVDKDKPLPPTPGSPAPSLASSGSAYSNYAEDDSEESNDNEPKIDMSEYVVVDLVSCESEANFKRSYSLSVHKQKLKKLKDLINVSDRVDVRLRLPLRRNKSTSEGENGNKPRPRFAQYIDRVGTILNAPHFSESGGSAT